MSRALGKIKSNVYRDGIDTALVKGTQDIVVNEGINGDYSVSSRIISLTRVSDSSGNLTVDLTPFSFTYVPVVQTTCIQTNASQYTGCQIVSVSSSSLVLKTFQTQNQSVLIGGTIVPVTPISTTVHISLFRPTS